MCGRFALFTPLPVLLRDFNIGQVEFTFTPSYNICPGAYVPVVSQSDSRRMTLMKWGLIPSWAENESIGFKMINARIETVHEKKSYRNAFQRRRCVIPFDGYFEWMGTGKVKQPYYFFPKVPSGLAGIWENWTGREGQRVSSFSVITVPAPPPYNEIHHRMPFLVPNGVNDFWLGGGELDVDKLLEKTSEFSNNILDYHRVSEFVNSTRNDCPRCIERVE